MNASLHSWARWLDLLKRPARRRPSRRVPDFADHGTAFGLDLSLSSPVTRPASPAPAPRAKKAPLRD